MWPADKPLSKLFADQLLQAWFYVFVPFYAAYSTQLFVWWCSDIVAVSLFIICNCLCSIVALFQCLFLKPCFALISSQNKPHELVLLWPGVSLLNVFIIQHGQICIQWIFEKVSNKRKVSWISGFIRLCKKTRQHNFLCSLMFVFAYITSCHDELLPISSSFCCSEFHSISAP